MQSRLLVGSKVRASPGTKQWKSTRWREELLEGAVGLDGGERDARFVIGVAKEACVSVTAGVAGMVRAESNRSKKRWRGTGSLFENIMWAC